MTTITEADVESTALDWLATIGWQTAHGPDIAPDTPSSERDALLPRLVSAISYRWLTEV
jgi:type I restriction enzyme R subunit